MHDVRPDDALVERATAALDAAIRILLIEEPFFAHVLSGIPRRVTGEVRTAAVGFHDPREKICKLLVNPRFLLALPEPQRVAVMKHEVLHLVLRHPFRDAGRDPRILGIAADLVVNALVAPWPLPPNAVTLEHFAPLGLREGESLDHYYRALERAAAEKPAFAEWLEGGDDPNAARGIGPGEHSRWPGESIDLDDDASRDAGDRAAAARLVDDAIERAWERVSAEARADLPGIVSASIEELLTTRRAPRDWTQTLRRFAQSVRRAPLRNTIRRPSRRFGTYPGLRLRRTSRLAVVVDTSRSIELPELERFFAEVHAIWRAGAEVILIECDAEVHRVSLYDGTPPSTTVGRGGTSFDPALARIRREELRTPFDGIIVLTDGYAMPPTIRPRCRHILWVLAPGGTDRHLSGAPVLRLRRLADRGERERTGPISTNGSGGAR